MHSRAHRNTTAEPSRRAEVVRDPSTAKTMASLADSNSTAEFGQAKLEKICPRLGAQRNQRTQPVIAQKNPAPEQHAEDDRE